jgi:hypothetical protein
MNKRYDHKRPVESLTVGQLVVSIRPSQLKSVIGVSVTIMVFAFYCGYRISQHLDELDMRVHLIRDAEEHNKHQSQLNDLEEGKRTLEMMYQRLKESQGVYQQRDLPIIELPQKQMAVIKVVPKGVIGGK